MAKPKNGALRLIDTNGLGSLFSFSCLVGRVVVAAAPPRGVSQNDRVHYMARHKATSFFRARAEECGSEWAPRTPLVGKVLAVCRIGWTKGHKRMDPSNAAASLKAMIDGLTDAGWWVDDNQVIVHVEDQFTWGSLSAGEQGLYPDGFVTVDVLVPSSDDSTPD